MKMIKSKKGGGMTAEQIVMTLAVLLTVVALFFLYRSLSAKIMGP